MNVADLHTSGLPGPVIVKTRSSGKHKQQEEIRVGKTIPLPLASMKLMHIVGGQQRYLHARIDGTWHSFGAGTRVVIPTA